VRDPGAAEKVDAADDPLQGDVGPRHFPVALERGLDVHGHPVEEAQAEERLEPVGERAVRVQLDQEAPLPDDPDDVLEVLVEERLAAREADGLEPALAAVEIGQEEIDGQGRERLRLEDEPGVVAVGAAEVAAAEEHGRGDVPGEVAAGELL